MNALDRLFRNRQTGEITIWQSPNIAAKVMGVGGITHWLFPDDRVGEVAGTVSSVALGWWAADELLRGANPYRRLTGAAVLVFLGLRLLR